MSRPDAKSHRRTCQPRRTAAVSGRHRPPARIGEPREINSQGMEMALIHYVVTGSGRPPIVFVHGFACAHSDWDAQVAHLSPNHQTIAVDLRGHGASRGEAAECSIER